MGIKRFLIVLLFFTATISFAQQRIVVRFTDKQNSPFSIQNPQQFLSPKAIDRRTKHDIAITDQDLPVNQVYIDSVLSKGSTYINRSKWMNLVQVRITDTAVIQTITALPFVAGVEVVKRNDTLSSLRLSNKFDLEGTTNFDYGYGADQITIMQGDFLHQAGYLGEGLTIAVLDAGFDHVDSISAFSHLWSDNRILGYWDFVNNDDSVFGHHGHGTSVLSTMAAHIPGQLIGTAFKASYWLLRSEDAGTESLSEEYNWLAAAEFADSVGADVINSSLGYTTFDDSLTNHAYTDMDGNTTVITRAADLAFEKGILVVNSAGNSGSSPWYYIAAPADGHHVLAVGATEHDGNYASFSSRGPSYDGRVKPDVSTIGRYSAVVDVSGNVVYNNGTSFASPEMAGMAAVLWQAFPDKTNQEIKEAIIRSAHHYANPDDKLGYGIPNFRTAYLMLSGYQVDNIYENQLLKIYPQPFVNEFNLVYYSAYNQSVQINIQDISGKQVYQYNWSVQEGVIENITITHALSSGIYTLQLIDGEGLVISNKIIKR
ncbi:MAG: S8 family serine peptidase [Flavobacteriales bacterium]|nr:S8 family serine peptidase [Flavobacteriales bacterium]